jgi:ABC-type transporter lipoprotein component MlaA
MEGMEDRDYRVGFELTEQVPDRIEGFNRVSFAVTKFAADWLLRPVATVWSFVLPDVVRESLENATYNVRWPGRFVSLLLQGEGCEAGEETVHFLVNSTVGLAGLFDVAEKLDVPTYDQDMGLVFHRWGIGHGSYLVIPLVGPSSLRDGFGSIFDTAMDPLFQVPFATLTAAVNSFSLRLDAYDTITESQAAHLYLTARVLWAVHRRIEEERYEIPESAYATSDPDPSLGSLLAEPRDPKFADEARERRVEVAATGRRLPYSVWLQPEPAPVAYVIPGIGAHRTSPMALLMAELAWETGHSVVLVSSPFHPEFVRNALSHPYPGYTPLDAEDVYAVLDAIATDLGAEYGDRIRGAKLMGYSLGGIEALFLADAQPQRGADRLRFDRFVALNPPVDLVAAAKAFEADFQVPLRWPEAERERRIQELAMKVFLVSQDGLPEGRPLPVDRDESRFLIGMTGRITLATTLGAVARNGDRVLEPLQLPGRGRALDRFASITYPRYGEELVVPWLKQHLGEPDPAELVHLASLRALDASTWANPDVRIVHNADDFILADDGLAFLEANLGDRLTVFPGGGHLGNLHLPEVQQAVQAQLGPAR